METVVIPAITKSIEAIIPADLEELAERRWPETENVEYKAELHRERDGRPDPWYTGGNISGPSKNKIFKELVAFANTSGGRLFLGIKETTDRPPCADAIQPIPRCCELAERLEQSIVSSIDPPLTFLRLVGIPMSGDSGVIVAEVSCSYNGPHRSPDLNCYVRKGTNSVPVTMREVHDMVMRLSRREDEIRRRLSDSREGFREWVGVGPAYQKLFVGFRVTALPVSAPLYIERSFNDRKVSFGFNDVSGTWKGDEATSRPRCFASPLSLSERPFLRGAAWVSSPNSERSGRKIILRDGFVEIRFKWPWYQPQHESHQRPILHFDWIIAACANAIASADGFRKAVQAPGCEYGLELEILATNGPAEIPAEIVQTGRGFSDPLGPVSLETPTILGPYSLGEGDAVLNLIVRDLLDAHGVVSDWPALEIDWAGLRA